jgi:hypothetical protein
MCIAAGLVDAMATPGAMLRRLERLLLADE